MCSLHKPAGKAEHQKKFFAVDRVVGAFGHSASGQALLDGFRLFRGDPRLSEVERRVAGAAGRFE